MRAILAGLFGLAFAGRLDSLAHPVSAPSCETFGQRALAVLMYESQFDAWPYRLVETTRLWMERRLGQTVPPLLYCS